jgi:hypothetical protein
MSFLPLGDSALAEEVTAEVFAELVADAPDDADALSRLRAVTAVDGQSVDMHALLDGASGSRLEQRLAALDAVAEPGNDADDARAEAAEILSDRRFRESDSPKPLKGLFEWLEERTRGLRESVGAFARAFPGGLVVFWMFVAAAVALLAMVVAARLATRRQAGARTVVHDEKIRESSQELLRAAEAAEKDGDLQTALRLSFRAGLLRLAERGLLPGSRSLTSGEISDLLNSTTFDRLAATFDRIVYGRRAAAARDVEESKSGWRSVESEVHS